MNENTNILKKRPINERLKVTVIGCGACGNGIAAEIEKDVFAWEVINPMYLLSGLIRAWKT